MHTKLTDSPKKNAPMKISSYSPRKFIGIVFELPPTIGGYIE